MSEGWTRPLIKITNLNNLVSLDPTSIGNLGMFMALTGHRLKGEDCLHSGIATHGCKSELLPKLKVCTFT